MLLQMTNLPGALTYTWFSWFYPADLEARAIHHILSMILGIYLMMTLTSEVKPMSFGEMVGKLT